MNFIQQAYKGKTDWIYWLISILVILFGWQILGIIPLMLAGAAKADSVAHFLELSKNAFATAGLDKNLYLFVMLFTFLAGFIFLLISIKYIHKRSFTSLVTSRKKIDWKRFFFAFALWGCVAIVMIFINMAVAPEDYVFNFNPIPFFILLAICCILLPIQTSFEELLFRGYFMQGLGILAKNRWLPLVITAVVFGVLHGANPEVVKLGQVSMVYYIGTGLLFGVTTLMDEGTEIALGLHAANNIVAAFLVTTDWMVFQTDALFRDISEPSASWDMFIPVFVLYPLLLVVFAKKYKWTHWKEKLTGAITKPATINKTHF